MWICVHMCIEFYHLQLVLMLLLLLIFLAPHILFWKQMQDITDFTGLLGKSNGVSYLRVLAVRVFSPLACLKLYRIVRTRDNYCHPPCNPRGSQ